MRVPFYIHSTLIHRNSSTAPKLSQPAAAETKFLLLILLPLKKLNKNQQHSKTFRLKLIKKERFKNIKKLSVKLEEEGIKDRKKSTTKKKILLLLF